MDTRVNFAHCSQTWKEHANSAQRGSCSPSGVWNHDSAKCSAHVPSHWWTYSLNHWPQLEQSCEPSPWGKLFWSRSLYSGSVLCRTWRPQLLNVVCQVHDESPDTKKIKTSRLFHFYFRDVFLFYLSWTKSTCYQLCSHGINYSALNLMCFRFGIYL